jgi:hypothetical protein
MTVLDIVKAGIVIAFVAFVAFFGFAIPIYIFKKEKADENYDAENVWGNGAVGIFAFLLLCTVCTFFSAFIFNNPIFVFAAGALFLVLLISFFFATDSACDEEEAYLYSLFAAMIYFAVALLFVLLAGLQEQQKAEREAENAQYNQTVTFYLDANENKVDTGNYSYPVNSLRTNNTGDTYTWVERKADGNLTARTVQKVPDSTYEVTLRDDLPATDTEPRVERSVEYQLKGEEVNAGKEPCASRYDSKELTNYLPACDKDKTLARLTKVRTIIHIPAGSADKMVPATNS